MIFRIVSREGRRLLIDIRIHNDPDQPFQIVPVLPEVLGQKSQDFRVARKIGGIKVINGIDESRTKEVSPHPAHKRLCKILIVRSKNQVR